MGLNILTLGSSKTYTNLVALGISSAVVDDTAKTITFTLAADGSQHTIHFNQPSDGVSVTGISDKGNGVFTLLFSDGSESDPIQTIKGQKGDKGDKLTFNDLSDEEKASLKGSDGFSPSAKIEKIGDTATITITDKDGTTTATIKDGQGGTGGSGEENKIDSISVNGVNVAIDENKNVDITVPSIDGLAKTEDIPTKVSELTNDSGYLTEHQDISGKVDKVDGKSLIADTEIERLASVDNYDDTQVKTQIQAVANGLMDSVGYSADYKTIDIIAKNGVKKSVNVAPIISHASITELSDVDTTNKATGKALVYNATTSKHEYADVSGTDEKVKMDASTDAKYLGELLDNVTIANENGELKVKKLDGQEVTITEINYLKGLTMNVMDLVNMFSNGGVKIINTPVATYAELLTLDKSSFIEGISYLVYVLADENHDNAKTTYLVDKVSEIPTYFGFADSQRDFTTNPIDLATEITGKLGISNMDSDAIKVLFTVDNTYKTETATNNAFSTHGAKALYDELLLAIGNKANSSDLTAHKDDADIHVSTEDRTKWDSAKTHADSAHAPSNAQANVLEIVKVNGTALTPSSKAVNVTVPTTVAELTDSADYAKKTDLHSHDNKSVLDGITSDKVTYWDNKSEFSGSYNDLNDKPTIDAELSNTSENAIQNKVVTKEINKLYSDISFNDFDTATSGTSFTDAEDGNMLVTDWTKNLLNPTLETTTQNGVTCTNNGDGTYTLNGTASSDTYFILKDITKFEDGKYKIVGFKNATDNDFVYANAIRRLNGVTEYTKLHETYFPTAYLSNDVYKLIQIGIAVISGTTLTNEIVKPMLTTDLSATYDDFVPYGGYDIKTCGKNLMSVNDATNGATLDTQTRFNIRIRGLDKGNIASDRIYLLENGVMKGHQSFTFEVTIDEPYGIAIKHNGSTNDIDIEYINYMVRKGTYTISFDVASNNPSVESGLLLHNIQLEHGDTETDYEPYQGESITVTNDTESPAFGLKSHKSITNIISPANVKCVYPTNESGKGVLDSLYNKDKMLTEQNESLSVIGKCKNFLNPTLQTTTQNGVTCTANGDGTYTLNGTSTDMVTFIVQSTEDLSKKHINEDLWLVGCPKNGSMNTYKLQFWNVSNKVAFDFGSGAKFRIENSEYGNIAIRIEAGVTVNNLVFKPMLTTNLSATYDDFVPYTGDGETLTHDVAEIKKDLGGLTFSASGTTLSITDGTNTWTLGANS